MEIIWDNGSTSMPIRVWHLDINLIFKNVSTVTLPHWSSMEYHQMAGDNTTQNYVAQKHRWYIKDSTNWCVLGNYIKGCWALILQYNIHPYTFFGGFNPNYGYHYESTLYVHTHSSSYHGNYVKGFQALISQYSIHTYTHTLCGFPY